MRFLPRPNKVTALVVLLVLALATLGVGYGLWEKILYIDGTVGTGDVDAEWTWTSSGDPLGAIDPGHDKDVGRLDCEINTGDPQIIDFVVINGYPSYTGDCEVHFTSLGTIPVKVESITFLPGTLTGCTVVQSPTTGSFVATCDQLTVTWADALCAQLHTDDFLASSLIVHVEQPAEENSQYTFGVGVQLVQWNESTCP